MSSKKYTGLLAGKLKSKPEFFIVEEVPDIKIEKDKQLPYTVYRLEKEGWNTPDVLIRIARKHKVPLQSIQYAGKKDRHAKTIQYITFKGKKNLETKTDAWKLLKEGYSNEPLAPGKIVENRFQILITSMQIKEFALLESNLERIRNNGIINYYDSQRFGTFQSGKGIPIMKLYSGNIDTALKEILCYSFRNSSKQAIRRKQEILRAWPDFQICYKLADSRFEKEAFQVLSNNPNEKEKINILNSMPAEELQMQLSAMQSLLFNETLVELIERKGVNLARLKTKTGDLVFPLADPRIANTIPVPGYNNVEELSLYSQVHKRYDIDIKALGKFSFQNARLKGFDRKTIVYPHGLDFKADRLDGKPAIWLYFSLPSGSYATMLVKQALLRVSAGKLH